MYEAFRVLIKCLRLISQSKVMTDNYVDLILFSRIDREGNDITYDEKNYVVLSMTHKL